MEPVAFVTQQPRKDSEDRLEGEFLGSQALVGVTFTLMGSLLFATSNVIIKHGLRLAGARGVSAGDGGYTYLVEPTWWAGMGTMMAGELANFSAYAFSPPTLVTPLGSFSSIVLTVIFAHLFANERLNMFGALGCILAVAGSMTMTLSVPEERSFNSVLEVWQLAIQPGFLAYSSCLLAMLATLILHSAPRHGHSNVFVYATITALVGSLSIMAAKALAIAVRLTAEGSNQFVHPQTYFFAAVIVTSLIVQQSYTNKALDIFTSGLVIPVNYIVFNISTITGYIILFQVAQTATEIGTEVCGFVTVVAGIFLIYTTKWIETGHVNGILRMSTKAREEGPSLLEAGGRAEQTEGRGGGSQLRGSHQALMQRDEQHHAADRHYPIDR